ncbi:sigma factor [Streptomyces sp. VB1]|uniref:sigma factor n=1 Tax=Streptomyces sp. VB1 TaxID=2986803 RepID=UPI0022421CFD|nr:sigma factor [Streptomyces sp. VB1]UZI33918.1 hypothetical protein OH133_37900 [Streptomyces sp. VB1]
MELGSDGYGVLVKKVIAFLTGFKQLNAAEREDVVGEAIVRAVSRAQFDPSDQPVAYIKTIARNMALEKLNKLKEPGTEVASVLMDHADLDALACTAEDAGEAEQEQEQELTDLFSQAESTVLTGRTELQRWAASAGVSASQGPPKPGCTGGFPFTRLAPQRSDGVPLPTPGQ